RRELRQGGGEHRGRPYPAARRPGPGGGARGRHLRRAGRVFRMRGTMGRFQGKTALVTGAAGGIGAAVVRMLRAEGARVAVADRDVSAVGAEAHLPGDLRDPAYADGLPAAVLAALGRLDIVVNNAGVITRGKV